MQRMGLIHWILMIAAAALPMQAFGVAIHDGRPESWGVAWVSLALAAVGLGAILSTLKTRRARERAIGATWSVLAFQCLGAVTPAELSVFLMSAGLAASGFLWLWLAGHVHT